MNIERSGLHNKTKQSKAKQPLLEFLQTDEVGRNIKVNFV